MTISTKHTVEHRHPAGDGAATLEKIEPFFFRQDTQSLYACHHFPFQGAASTATLICNSVAHEYERCHRSMRVLAMQLAYGGQHVIRFDYAGMGNSAGDFLDVSSDQLRQDIAAAIDECKRRAGVDRINVVGIRLGATLAAQVAGQRDDVSCLVLYAPVLDGAALISEWQAEQEKFLNKHSHKIANLDAREVLGFPMCKKFQTDLCHSLAVSDPAATLQRVLVVMEKGEGERFAELINTLTSKGADVGREVFDGAAIWRREPMEAIVPVKILRRIAAWVKEGE